MADPLKLFILAGEPSGDRIAADLVERLQQRMGVDLVGVGGQELAGRGLVSLYPMSDLAVMGIRDVVMRLPLLFWRIAQTARAIRAADPDIVVLVDAQEFSERVAKRLRKAGWRKPIILYVAPSVWARHPERAARIKPLFDEVLAVLPFEPAAMRRLGGPPTSYVGHPALREAGTYAGGHKVALLPGSRKSELRRHMPLLRSVAEMLAGKYGVEEFFIPTLPTHEARLRMEVAQWSVPVRIVADRAERRELYEQSMFAICTSGTATLEIALAGVPMIIPYVMEGAQAAFYERAGRPNVGLPNIILDASVAPELILPAVLPSPVLAAAEAILRDEDKQKAQREAYSVLRRMMEEGLPDAQREDPADRVLAHLKSR
ncbi:lipid-A-disaccharide synthase [Youhaiella tibetensis]|uniref:Lipid-A-disaccharide synthase n=1 Tax=Paradevosia tibetensis TaxID=1447062 RepID=A0A5B9DMS9_9HYPH|nr:lipid-A-disaccharide synthase [Youhaiella tibetensis]QEE20497.1 lipid-A-disaccharide synthase [Youhaiella tibetensis]GGF23631.1 lipid-A-disaccharide synthase [Youhaiella tibetensis]